MIRISAVMVVRNEADLLAANLRYHAAQGVTEFRIVDNGSSDGTARCLRELSRTLNVMWTRDEGPYQPSDLASALASEAFCNGADWILPVDADEFWSAGSRSLAQALAASPAADVEAEVVTFIQDRRSRRREAGALLTMMGRVRRPHPYDRCRELIESRQIAFVEMEYPAKWIPRAAPGVRIRAGAHGVAARANPAAPSSGIVCLHAPIRSRQVLDARAEHGNRMLQVGCPPDQGWYHQRWYRLQMEGRLDDEWHFNSARDGCLEMGERRTPLLFDPRLSNVVRPWIADHGL